MIQRMCAAMRGLMSEKKPRHDFREAIAAALAAAKHSYGAELLPKVTEGVCGAIDLIRSTVPADRLDQFDRQIRQRAEVSAATMFLNIDYPSRPNFEFYEQKSDRLARFHSVGAVRMDLGTFNTWPDKKAAALVSSDGLADFIRLDMQVAYRPDIAASVTALPFADSSIDLITSSSLLEHVPYPHDVLREAFRVLRPGGLLQIGVPFMFVEHPCPGDYLRFTGQFFTEVCAALGFTDVAVDQTSHSGAYSTVHQTIKSATVNEADPLARPTMVSHLVMTALSAILTGIDTSFHAFGASLYFNVEALATKPGEWKPRADTIDRTLPFVDRYRDLLICPMSGLPVRRRGNQLVSLDGVHAYKITDGVPEMVALHGFGSSMIRRASSEQQLKRWRRRAPWRLFVSHRG